MRRVPNVIEIIEIPERLIEVQVRTHRKKRINKKWRKRYGVKLVVDMNCYLYHEYGCIKVLAPQKVASKLRDDIARMEMGVINELKFKMAQKNDTVNIPFLYKGGI